MTWLHPRVLDWYSFFLRQTPSSGTATRSMTPPTVRSAPSVSSTLSPIPPSGMHTSAAGSYRQVGRATQSLGYWTLMTLLRIQIMPRRSSWRTRKRSFSWTTTNKSVTSFLNISLNINLTQGTATVCFLWK
ncbi:hypothetical protein OF83DRAFT_632473 [Amylostereum chailletii]|nr:hypothetical protein OF83DRAFT_632473 [Amylostereum chailletii]